MKTLLLVIDPQNDFCLPTGSLCVPGALEDMTIRLPKFIKKMGRKIDAITCTLDQHQPFHIAHSCWYKPNPAPFTVMSNVNGEIIGSDGNKYVTTIPSLQKWTLFYLAELTKRQRYPHVIWPEHCLIGTQGSNIVTELFDSFQTWCKTSYNNINYVSKGSNPLCEHFGAVFAEVEDPNDYTTKINTGFVNDVMSYDRILFCGEAGTHCVPNTGRDLNSQFTNGDLIKKFVLLTDCISPVTGFEPLQDNFIKDMCALGMQEAKSTDF